MNILITSAGRRVSLVKFFMQELNKIDPKYKVFTADLNPELSSACNISDRYFKVPRVTDEKYIHILLELVVQQNIKLVIPTIDTELQILSRNTQKFEALGVKVVVSKSHFIKECRDKRNINSFFNINNIKIPTQYTKEEYILPLFIKPYDGSLSVDTFLIKNKSDFNSYHFDNEKLMFMEYIDREKYDEYTIDMYYGRDNLLKMLVPRKRIEIRSGEINKGLTCKNEIVLYLKERLNYIDGAIGCLTTQVFFNNQTKDIIAIEINPRFGGGYPLSYHAGANYPKFLIQEYLLNETIEYSNEWEDNLLMLRYDDEVLIHGFKS